MLLAVLALTDNYFLVSLSFVMLKHINKIFDIVSKYEIICKLTAFSTFMSSFLSVW
jgi:hypothetical protein